ncbi:hypothetical protein RYX36_001777, partial [Vicia faba]
MIKLKKWTKFFQQPLPYNTQLVNEFYANSNNKRDEAMVTRLKITEDQYQEILKKADDDEFDVYMQSLCNMGTAWLDLGGEKTIKRMDLEPESKAWYQFIKNSLKLTTHNKTVDKERLT